MSSHGVQVTLCTTVENQPVALIEVYEGESAAARENSVVATVTLPLAPAPFGSPNILVRCAAALNSSGPLHGLAPMDPNSDHSVE